MAMISKLYAPYESLVPEAFLLLLAVGYIARYCPYGSLKLIPWSYRPRSERIPVSGEAGVVAWDQRRSPSALSLLVGPYLPWASLSWPFGTKIIDRT